MSRFVEGENRNQSTLFPEKLDDYIGDDNPVRVIDVYVDELDLRIYGALASIPSPPTRVGLATTPRRSSRSSSMAT